MYYNVWSGSNSFSLSFLYTIISFDFKGFICYFCSNIYANARIATGSYCSFSKSSSSVGLDMQSDSIMVDQLPIGLSYIDSSYSYLKYVFAT